MVLTSRKAQTETMTSPLQQGAGAPQAPYSSTASGMVVNGLTKLYQRGGNTVQALAGVSLSIPQGSQLAIMGPSGCGKTTLLHCLAGVLRPTTGSITLDGTEITQLSEGAISELRLKHFGFVFQDGQLLPELPCQELSGGQAQRVAIGRALITNPKVVFADEPTGALDQSTGAEVMGVLTYACQSTRASLILVTHDPSVAARLPHEIHMRDGLIDQQVSR